MRGFSSCNHGYNFCFEAKAEMKVKFDDTACDSFCHCRNARVWDRRRKHRLHKSFRTIGSLFDKWNSTQITWPIKSNNFSSIAAEDHASKVLWRRTAGSRAIQSCRSFFCDMTWLNTKNKTFVKATYVGEYFLKIAQRCSSLVCFFYVRRITRLKNHFYSADKLLTSEGKELRRALFSLKQIFQEDKDLVHGFVALGGLNCLVRIGNEADQNYQNYILRALGQVGYNNWGS